ncbi:MAG: hypothetical protein WCF67_10695, partial [Chitinophagaceae bacterium]
VVKGLANVNTRIGFNSNWHLLQALFSFHYFPGGPVNNINGLLLLIAFPYSLGGLKQLMRKDYRLSMIIRSLLFIPLIAFHFGASSDYIFFNVNFISSPSADIAVCVLLWLLFTWLIELDGATAGVYYRKALAIILLTVFLFTVKPSSAPMLIAWVFFFFGFILKKRKRLAMFAMITAIVVIGPWMIRNVLISGYVLFPFDGIDVVQADWKLPVQHVKWHANAVKVYAIDPGYDLNKPLILSTAEWFPGWFERLGFIQVVMFASALVSLFVCMIVFLFQAAKNGKDFMFARKHTILAVCIMFAGIIFWFLKGPDFRLGYGFVAMPTILVLAFMLQYFLGPDAKYAAYLFISVMACIMLYHYRLAWKEMPKAIVAAPAERRQPDSVKQVIMSNGILMNIIFSDDSWFAPLPVANNNEFYTVKPVLRGKTIREGFKPSVKRKTE